MRSLLLSICLVAAAGVVSADDADCEYSRPVRTELDAGGASLLDLRAAAGSLRIEGDPTVDRVIVDATACASRESLLDDIRLETERRGDRLVVEVLIPDSDWSWRHYARLDLHLTVPAGLALEVEDGSGEIEIENVASLELDDGSGSIEIADVRGDVEIEDGSGGIDVRDVGGVLRLLDGSGEIVAERVGERVHVSEDGSGEIRIVDVRGDVVIDSDGSGGITIRDVLGSVRIGSDGSGSIYVARVEGDFDLRSDGSGSVHVDDVSGAVRIP